MATIGEFINSESTLNKTAAWSDMLLDWAYVATGGDPVNRADLLKDRKKDGYENKQQAVSANIFGNDSSILNLNAKSWNNDRTTPEDLWNIANSIANNKHLATGATYNLMKVPEGRRENSALVQSFRSTAQLLRDYGKQEQADKLDNAINKLTTQVGSLGNTWMSPEQISQHVSAQMRSAMDDLRNNPDVKGVLGDRIAKWDADYSNRTKSPEYKKAIMAYAKNYLTPNVYSKIQEQSLKGYLKDPAIAESLKYLTPILAGGLPIATVASLLGNNSLWLPLIATGTLGAGYGYAKNKGYMPGITNSSIGQFIDRAVNSGNNLIRSGINRVAPTASPITDRLFNSYQAAPEHAQYLKYLQELQRRQEQQAVQNSIMPRPALES